MSQIEDDTLARVKKVSEYRPVSEKEYLAAIEDALNKTIARLKRVKGDTYSRRRAEEIVQALRNELKPKTTSFIRKFLNDMFALIWLDNKQLNEDMGYIKGFYKLQKSVVKDLMGFSNIMFTTETADGTLKHSMISVDNLLKSVDNDTVKQVRSAIISGSIQGVNPNVIASQIGDLKGVEAAHLRTVVRTMNAEAQSKLNMASLKANSDVYDGYEYSAKLDNRTTKICRHNDGTTWKKYDDIPKDMIPPMHPSCRSTIVGIIHD